MPSVHPLTKDALVVTLGAGPRERLSLRRGALEMLLDPPEGVRPTRVPLLRGRDEEAGDVTLSRSRRNLQFRVLDPPRLLLASAEQARRLLKGQLGALALVEATDSDAAPAPPADPDAAERKRREAADRLRALVEKRLPRRPGEPGEEEGDAG